MEGSTETPAPAAETAGDAADEETLAVRALCEAFGVAVYTTMLLAHRAAEMKDLGFDAVHNDVVSAWRGVADAMLALPQ